MTDQILLIVVSSALSGVITGIISSITTVKALHVHINYLRESVETNRIAIARAHQRIDNLKE